MKKIILNNKSNLTYKEVIKYKEELEKINTKNCEIIYMPSVNYLALFNNSKINIGAQNFYSHAQGSYTGEINLEILKDMKINYVLVGHSDRKTLNLDSYALIKEKLFKSIGSGFQTILCVGALDKKTDNLKYIKKELNYLLKGVIINDLKNLSIAYEPTWAIGNDVGEEPNNVIPAVKLIKEYMLKKFDVDINVYYGGTVDETNILSYLEFCDGVLIGKKSNDIKSVKSIIKAVGK